MLPRENLESWENTELALIVKDGYLLDSFQNFKYINSKFSPEESEAAMSSGAGSILSPVLEKPLAYLHDFHEALLSTLQIKRRKESEARRQEF